MTGSGPRSVSGSAPVAVVVAVDGMPGETDLVSVLAAPGAPTRVVRRCVDVAELAGVAAARTAQVAVVAEGRGVDAALVAELAVHGLRTVVLAASAPESGSPPDLPAGQPADPPADLLGAHLVAFGAAQVVARSASPDAVVRAVLAAAARPPTPPGGLGAPRPAPESDSAHGRSAAPEPMAASPDRRATARLIAVWGPTGAPGRTTVAVAVATELATAGRAVLLVDLDTYGPSVGAALGLLDEASGVAAAARHARVGRLDDAALRRSARAVPDLPGLSVLTGLTRPDRWPELDGVAVEQLLGIARWCADVVVVDCGFGLEQDEELMLDSVAPRRNAATITALELADAVVAVGRADPVGLQRLVSGLDELRSLAPNSRPYVVVNRLTTGRGRREVEGVLERFAGVPVDGVVPEDPAVRAAFEVGRALVESAPRSPARHALAVAAAALGGS